MLLPLHLNGLNLDSGTAVVSLSGTVDGATEQDIRDGGRTIILTLTNDTWVAAGSTFDAQRQNILDGITGTTFIDDQSVTTVVRTSDTVVTITLEAVAGYNITADETGSVTVPATALTGGSELTANDTFTVSAIADAVTRGRSKRRIRYIVEVDGQQIAASSLSDAEAILLQARELAKESAPKDTRKARTRIKPPRVAVKTASGNETTSVVLKRQVKDTQQAVNAIYRKAFESIEREREISRLLRKKIQDEDDEEAAIALLL